MRVDLGYAMTLTPEKAVAYFESKGYAFGFRWQAVADEAHARAFTVAGILKLDVLSDIRDAQHKMLQQGQTFEEAKKALIPVLERKGWLGKGLKASPDGELEGKKLLPYRLETIFRTNTQSAYMAGRYQRLRENVDQRPYWQYVAVMDSHTRPSHAALHGRVFRYDDAGWDTLFPPNGYNCRCRVRALTADQLARHPIGLESTDDYRVTVDQPQGVNGKTRPVTGWKDPKTGQVFTPDAGFHLNPGKGYLRHLGEQLLNRAARADIRLAAQAVEKTLGQPALLHALNRDTGHWISQVMAQRLARGDVRPVGALRPAVVDALADRGVVPDSAVITLTDANLLHVTRENTPGALPATFWSALVSSLYRPRAILYRRHPRTPVLLYVFDLEESARQGVVAIEGLVAGQSAGAADSKVGALTVRAVDTVGDLDAFKHQADDEVVWGRLA
ncbi:phage minor head protein [Sodalis endosymbiont of Spalangia cameroni]|uniref:phage head morphogenesis protein n=1 Tax=Sodalis praecaptivus TaxID=1239307 RepID=UPI0031F7CC13